MVVVGAGVIGIEYALFHRGGGHGCSRLFGEPVGNKLGDLQPIGIDTIPEVSFVGRTENELTIGRVLQGRRP